MTRILVLEYFPNPEVFEDRRVRQDRWNHLKTSYAAKGVLIDIAVPALDDEGNKLGGKFVSPTGKPFAVGGYDLLFVHQTDMDLYVDEAVDRSIPVICYGGGGERLDIARLESLIIDFLPMEYLETNVTRFIDRIVVDRAVTIWAFNVLIGFDPSLECRLEILHMCLTQEGAGRLARGEFSSELDSERSKFWTTPLVDLWPSLKMDKDSEPYRDLPVSALVKQLSKTSNCFSDEYLKIVGVLQKALLAEG